MPIPEMYDYLVRARRDLRATLESLPDEVLSRPLLNGSQFHCIKDFVSHLPAVEDGWIHEDILRDQTVRETIPALNNSESGTMFAGFELKVLLDYWRGTDDVAAGAANLELLNTMKKGVFSTGKDALTACELLP